MLENRVSPGNLARIASVLEDCFEEIYDAYEKRLLDMGSPLVVRPEIRAQIRAQAWSVLEEVARSLRDQGREAEGARPEGGLAVEIGVSRATEGVHAIESLRAVVALSEAALLAVIDSLPRSQASAVEVAQVALLLQSTIMKDVTRAAISYGDFLLRKVHESHADERRRISRELHDGVAHAIMVAFRNLEFYEGYRTSDPAKAEHKLKLAGEMAQEALRLTRDLSMELRKSSAEEGLETGISELLGVVVPAEVRSQVSVEGDESFILPGIRDELFLILREAVRNAATHSKAREICVKLYITGDRVEASVEDDGHGFKEGEVSSGAGLVSMRERVSLLGGDVDLRSVPGEGTRVKVLVPLPRIT